MSEDEKIKRIQSLKPGIVDAIDAMFDMEAAIRENGLSIHDLMEGLALAIDGPRQGNDGHDLALVSMGMMTIALEQDRTRPT